MQYVTDTQDKFDSSPSMTALRVFLWLSDLMKVNIGIQDVSTAFLHTEINEEIYVNPPSGFTRIMPNSGV